MVCVGKRRACLVEDVKVIKGAYKPGDGQSQNINREEEKCVEGREKEYDGVRGSGSGI